MTPAGGRYHVEDIEVRAVSPNYICGFHVNRISNQHGLFWY